MLGPSTANMTLHIAVLAFLHGFQFHVAAEHIKYTHRVVFK